MNESGRTYCSREWVTKRTSPLAMASDQYVRKRHGKMFDETWKWAGTYRLTGKNIAEHLRSEEHTSELQSRENLVCRLLLEKKKKKKKSNIATINKQQNTDA